MDFLKFLSHVTTVPGPSGYELPVAEVFARAFEPYCDEVSVDFLGSVLAVQKSNTGKKGPRIMLCAHIDEVGLMTTGVEEDGSVRFLSRGVAAQTLPAQEVRLLTKEGPLFGVIGAMPPHLTDAAARGEVTPVEKLFIDTGLAADEVKRRVPVGTPVQLVGRTMPLLNDLITSKTMDDRACAAILLCAAEELRMRLHDAEICYVISAREEIDSLGAQTMAERICPDAAIVLDVTHGTMDDCPPGRTFPLDATDISAGPNTHRKLADFMIHHAQELKIKTMRGVAAATTWTDAWEIQVSCEGIPSVVVSLPLKYMHTTVETGSAKTMREQARLICEAVCAMHEGWEETLCY